MLVLYLHDFLDSQNEKKKAHEPNSKTNPQEQRMS